MDCVCRTCLTLGDLSPIFSNQKQHTFSPAVLLLTTGLKIELNDGLPQSICQGCTNLINSALKLRDQSHHAEQILLENGFQKVSDTGDATVKVEEPTVPAVHERLRQLLTRPNLGPNAICKDNIQFEINPNTSTILIKSDSKKSSIILKAAAQNSKQNQINEEISEPDKPILHIKESYVRTEDNDGSDDSGTLQDTKVMLARAKRKFPRKPRTTYVGKVERERLKLEASVAHRKAVDRVRHLMETEYAPDQPVQCRVCKKQFARLGNFIQHAKKHLLPKFMCEQCGRQFTARHSLKEHCMRWHGAERVLRCEHCDYRPITKTELKLHLVKVHTRTRPYVCEECGAGFYTRSAVRTHKDMHITTRDFQCDRCSSMFKSANHLQGHYSKRHRNSYAHLCYICPSYFTTRLNARKHLTKKHGIPLQKQGPLTVRKWPKDQPPPPDLTAMK